jgi:methylenetetrahydrofolate dehydrogenase (NADP+)/methenyltetrahydrofolate cyclohydrolase
MAEMLLQEDAVPIIGHSQTKRLDQHMRSSQIIVSAIGKPKFITQWNLTGGQVLIDVGINRDENGKLCGDFEAEACAKSEWYTPVPGGVGPMTIAMLMKNCLKAYKMQRGIV